MYKDLDEPIDVIVHFEKGALKPLRILWQGRSFKIVRVTGTWKAPKGDKWYADLSEEDKDQWDRLLRGVGTRHPTRDSYST